MELLNSMAWALITIALGLIAFAGMGLIMAIMAHLVGVQYASFLFAFLFLFGVLTLTFHSVKPYK